MNERIKELALKSGIVYLSEQTAYFKTNDGLTVINSTLRLTVIPSVDSLEKFAELIVAECADVCENLQKWPSTEPRHCANDIRIHFGVEE